MSMFSDHKSPCCDCGELTPDPKMRLYVRCEACSARLAAWMAERVKEAEERRKRLEAQPQSTYMNQPYDLWSDGELITYIGGQEDVSFEQAQRRQLFNTRKETQ